MKDASGTEVVMKMRRSRRERGCVAIASVSGSMILTLSASIGQQGPADPGRGHELAARLCTNCHVIGAETTGPVRADVPSFRTIGSRPGVTADHLAGRIIIPHPAMPGVPLTATEIRDIVAYIISLKRGD
jgi:mono/diheme cytochrome c family protein